MQEAACTTISSLVEANPDVILPFLSEILQVFNMVIDHYKGSSLVSLFDTLGTIA